MLHGTQDLFSASPLSPQKSAGTSGYHSAGSVDSGGTFHLSTRTQSRTSTSDPSVHSTPGNFIPQLPSQSEYEALMRAADAKI